MGDGQEVEYVADQGIVRLNVRRPIILHVPSDQVESYDPLAENDSPSASLELEWVYGYRGRDCRNNIFPLASGEVVYFAAAVAVIYNLDEKSQRIFIHHTDDIKCIAVHPDGKTVATGQIKGKLDHLPHVAIWDSDSLEVLHTFGSESFNRGVSAVAFSKDGDLLAVVDEDNDNHLSVWNWQDEAKISQAKMLADPVLGVAFSGESPSRIITSGKNHLAFWTLEDGSLSRRTAIFGSHGKPKFTTAVTSLPSGEIITGDSNGNILVWSDGGNTVSHSVDGAHDGSVFYLQVTEGGDILSSGSDGRINVYSSDLENTGDGMKLSDEHGAPRVAFKLVDRIIIGTTKNSILEATFESDPIPITQGHVEEVFGLAVDPTEAQFFTAGQDGLVFCRDSQSHETIWMKDLEMVCQSVDVSPSGMTIVVGGHAGKWLVLDKASQDVVFEGLDGEEAIQVVRFSPDGSRLALGSRDDNIYIYNVEDEEKSFSKAGALEGHSSFITHLDWSSDGTIIRSNSGDYEVLFWMVEEFSQITQSKEYKDVEFITNNCILSFNSIGIWPPGTDGTDINGCNKAVTKPLIATGDDFGNVKLFAYPASTQNAKNETYLGHSSHVTAVAFFNGDSSFVSAGGRDSTAMQWKVIDN